MVKGFEADGNRGKKVASSSLKAKRASEACSTRHFGDGGAPVPIGTFHPPACKAARAGAASWDLVAQVAEGPRLPDRSGTPPSTDMCIEWQQSQVGGKRPLAGAGESRNTGWTGWSRAFTPAQNVKGMVGADLLCQTIR